MIQNKTNKTRPVTKGVYYPPTTRLALLMANVPHIIGTDGQTDK